MSYLASELTPYDSHKSFYGKAVEYYNDKTGEYFLKSYSTIVAKITPDGKIFIDGEYSATTRRHIYAFAEKHGVSIANIKEMRKIIEESKGTVIELE